MGWKIHENFNNYLPSGCCYNKLLLILILKYKLREAANNKKVFFLSGQSTKALA